MDKIKLYVLDLGKMQMDKNLMINRAVLADSNEPNKRLEYIEFPIPAFLIQYNDEYILYDTGCHPDCMGKDGRWHPDFQIQNPYIGDEKHTLPYRLKQLGVDFSDIKTVIISHMHNDHAGCIEYFKDATFYVAESEFHASVQAYALHEYASPFIWKDTDVWIKQKHNWEFITQKDGDIAIRPGIKILNFGSGHSRCILGLYIELEKTGGVILSSDAIYCAGNVKGGLREPGIMFDSIGWRDTARRIVRLASETHSTIWFGHDTDQFDHLIKSDEGYYD